MIFKIKIYFLVCLFNFEKFKVQIIQITDTKMMDIHVEGDEFAEDRKLFHFNNNLENYLFVQQMYKRSKKRQLEEEDEVLIKEMVNYEKIILLLKVLNFLFRKR